MYKHKHPGKAIKEQRRNEAWKISRDEEVRKQPGSPGADAEMTCKFEASCFMFYPA